MRATLFDSAEPDLVSFPNSAPVGHVLDKVIVFRVALSARADRVVRLYVVGVRFAEVPAAVLAAMRRRVLTS
ncbi:MAG: hypothetical protein ABI577_10715 [bacterium]